MDRFEGGKDPFVLFLNVDDEYECKNQLWNKKDKNNSWTREAPIKKSEGVWIVACSYVIGLAFFLPQQVTCTHISTHI